MAQLTVRNLEEAVVRQLRAEAARENVSLEEAHRRVLRRAFLNDSVGQRSSLKSYLLEMPSGEEDDALFERVPESERPSLPDLDS